MSKNDPIRTALKNAIECLMVCADDSEEAGYSSRAESVREDIKAYKKILKGDGRMTMHERGKLARDVFNAVFDECETFAEDNIGKDLAYLMGAILDDTDKADCFVDWSKDISAVKPYICTILKEHLPKKHAVWKFIRL